MVIPSDRPTQPSEELSKAARIARRLNLPDPVCDDAPAGAPVESGTDETAEIHARFAALGENPSDMICELDYDFRFVYVSPNFRDLLHHKPASLNGHQLLDFVHPKDVRAVSEQLDELIVRSGSTRLLFRFRDARGEWHWLDSGGKAYATATGQARAIFIARDVTERQEIEEQHALLAMRDPTTMLYNKPYLVERLIEAVEAARKGNGGAAIYIDLDNFKQINDCCGHLAGDRLIAGIANLLHEAAPEESILSRFGGDEFILLLKGGEVESAVHVAEEIRDRLSAYRFINSGDAHAVTASIGVVPINGSLNSRELLNRANAACASAKALGGNRVEIFRDGGADQRDLFRDAARRSQQLLDGLAAGRAELWYQPVAHTRTGEVDHEEALIRLRESASVQSPSMFLPSAERFGTMEIVDRFVAEAAIRRLARVPEGNVAIILSGHAFARPDVTAVILDCLRQAGVDPQRLIVQVPWTAVQTTLAGIREHFIRLKEAGVRLGIKHFRADLAAVGYLRDFPVDYLKLDGGLTRDLVQSSLNQATVSALNEIGHALQARTIAEFVDDEPTLERLRQIGIDYAKGDLIGPPRADKRCG